MKHKLIFFFAAGLLLMGLIGCTPKDAHSFERAGYWKGSNNRIFIIYMKRPQDVSAIIEYANRLPHTSGRTTHAFFFSSPVRWGNSVTLARDFDHAYDIIDSQRRAGASWDFFYAKGLGVRGTVFVDCRHNRESSACTATR